MRGSREPPGILAGAQPLRVRPGPDRQGGGRHWGIRGAKFKTKIIVSVQKVFHLQPGGLRAQGGQVRHQVPQVQKGTMESVLPDGKI